MNQIQHFLQRLIRGVVKHFSPAAKQLTVKVFINAVRITIFIQQPDQMCFVGNAAAPGKRFGRGAGKLRVHLFQLINAQAGDGISPVLHQLKKSKQAGCQLRTIAKHVDPPTSAGIKTRHLHSRNQAYALIHRMLLCVLDAQLRIVIGHGQTGQAGTPGQQREQFNIR